MSFEPRVLVTHEHGEFRARLNAYAARRSFAVDSYHERCEGARDVLAGESTAFVMTCRIRLDHN